MLYRGWTEGSSKQTWIDGKSNANDGCSSSKWVEYAIEQTRTRARARAMAEKGGGRGGL